MVEKPFSALRNFLRSEAAGGIILMAAAILALLAANSPLAGLYFATLRAGILDGLMAVFFLLVGLEIKREVLDGQLSSWSRRLLPGFGAMGGMAVPALVYLVLNAHSPATIRGWAIPTATDIAFALGVLTLLGSRVPASLKVFLTALAILDDLGAVVIIAVFYTVGLSLPALGAALALSGILAALNRFGVERLWPYLIIGAGLWLAMLQSGIHATIAGVVLALTIPMRASTGAGGRSGIAAASPGAWPGQMGGVRHSPDWSRRWSSGLYRGASHWGSWWASSSACSVPPGWRCAADWLSGPTAPARYRCTASRSCAASASP